MTMFTSGTGNEKKAQTDSL